MNNKIKLGLFCLLFSLPIAVFATNGKVSAGLSVKDQGIVGASTALPLDSISTSENPASIGWLDNRVDFGITSFSPRRWYQATRPSGFGFAVAPGTHHSRRNYFFIPSLGFNRHFAEGKGAYGVALYGFGGMNSDTKTKVSNGLGQGVYGAGNTGVDLAQMFGNFALAWNFSPRFTLGGSLIIAGQSFAAKGLGNFAGVSTKPRKLTGNDSDYSFGYAFKLGFLAKVTKQLDIGASYQTESYMQKFDKYAGLFADNGFFNIEPIGNVGLALHLSDAVTTTLQADYIDFDAIKSIHRKNNCNLMSVCLGNKNGAGFGWQSMWVYKIGVQYKSSDLMTWRLGLSHGHQPIPSSQTIFNILAPGVVETHMSAGFTRIFGHDQNWEFSGFGQYVPIHSTEGRNQFDPNQFIRLSMRQYVFGFAIAKVYK